MLTCVEWRPFCQKRRGHIPKMFEKSNQFRKTALYSPSFEQLSVGACKYSNTDHCSRTASITSFHDCKLANNIKSSLAFKQANTIQFNIYWGRVIMCSLLKLQVFNLRDNKNLPVSSTVLLHSAQMNGHAATKNAKMKGRVVPSHASN